LLIIKIDLVTLFSTPQFYHYLEYLCVNQYNSETKIYAYEFILTHKKKRPEGLFLVIQFLDISTNSWSSQSNRSGLSSSKIQWEIVCVPFVHHLHSQTGTVQYVCPCVEHTTLTIKDGLVEVETVQVESHRGYTKCGEPDTNNGPCSKEEVQGT